VKAPILFVHGAFCRGEAWAGWRRHFEALGYRTYAPDLRHHEAAAGPQPDPRLAGTSLRDYAADLERQIETIGETPIVIGHSMGGLLAQMLAAKGRVRTAILLAPSTPWGIPPATTDLALAALGLIKAGSFWDMALVPAFDIAAQNSLNRLSPDAQREVFRWFVPESGRALFEILYWALDLERTSEVDERAIDCRMLALTGEDDLIAPPQVLSALARKYAPLLETRALPGHAHWLLTEPGWEAVADGIADWLDRQFD